MAFNDTVQNGSAIYDTQNTLAQKLAKRKLSQMQAQNAGDEQKRQLEAYSQQMAEQNNANFDAQAKMNELNSARAEMPTTNPYPTAPQQNPLPTAPTTPNDLRNKLPAAPTPNERLKKIAISRRSIGI